MGLTVSANSKRREPTITGLHRAVCFGVIDLGTQTDKMGVGKRKILFLFEFPDVRCDYEYDGEKINKPDTIRRFYNNTLYETSALALNLKSWRGRPFTTEEADAFDVKNVLGAGCNIYVTHNESKGVVYANIGDIAPLKKDQEKAVPENPILYFSFEDNMDIPNDLLENRSYKWIGDMIMKSPEWIARQQQQEPSVRDALTTMADDGMPNPEPLPCDMQDDEFDDDIPF